LLCRHQQRASFRATISQASSELYSQVSALNLLGLSHRDVHRKRNSVHLINLRYRTQSATIFSLKLRKRNLKIAGLTIDTSSTYEKLFSATQERGTYRLVAYRLQIRFASRYSSSPEVLTPYRFPSCNQWRLHLTPPSYAL
jgi:hypothetical protein